MSTKHQSGHTFRYITKGATTSAPAIIDEDGNFQIIGPTEIVEYDGDQYPWCNECGDFVTEDNGLSDTWIVIG